MSNKNAKRVENSNPNTKETHPEWELEKQTVGLEEGQEEMGEKIVKSIESEKKDVPKKNHPSACGCKYF